MALQRPLSAVRSAMIARTQPSLKHRALRWVVVGLLGLGLALLVGMQAAWAQDQTRTVPTDSGCETIQSCVDASEDGDTIEIRPGEYRENVTVDKDLTIQGTDCKNPRRVIVDAQPGGVAGDGFTVSADGVRILCLLVRNANTGIRGDGSDDLRLENIRVERTSSDNIDVTGDRLQLERSRLFASGDSALNLTGNDARIAKVFAAGHDNGCIHITGAEARVEGSQLERCEDDGGISIEGDDARVSGNTITASDGGIDVFNAATPQVTGNTVRGSGSDSFFVDCLDRCEDGLIEGNTATRGSNDTTGFVIVTDVAGLRILNNTASDNISDGFLLQITGAIVRGNTAERNGSEREFGFEIDGDDNLFEDNRAFRNEDDGFNISGNNNVFRRNQALSNSNDGFDVDTSEGTGNRLLRNVAAKNRAEGIENNGLLTDVIRNQASGNRTDCANDGTIDENRDNECEDGSDFAVPPEVD